MTDRTICITLHVRGDNSADNVRLNYSKVLTIHVSRWHYWKYELTDKRPSNSHHHVNSNWNQLELSETSVLLSLIMR